MRTALVIMVVICLARLTSHAQEATSHNIETHRLLSKVFDNTRTIRVLLPPDYRKKGNEAKRYPVLYLNDGIMVFDAFDIERTTHDLIATGAIPSLIIVGMDNGGSTDKTKNPIVDRANEYLPYPDVGFAPDFYDPEPPTPMGKSYPDFISEVMRLIGQKYRVKTGPNHTGIGGFSYGGVAALYAVMRRPELFGKLLLESPPLWIGRDKQLLKDTRGIRKWPAKIYFGLGTSESTDEAVNKEGKANQEDFKRIIRTKSPETSLKVVLEEGAKHEPNAWSKRFPSALQFLFGPGARSSAFCNRTE